MWVDKLFSVQKARLAVCNAESIFFKILWSYLEGNKVMFGLPKVNDTLIGLPTHSNQSFRVSNIYLVIMLLVHWLCFPEIRRIDRKLFPLSRNLLRGRANSFHFRENEKFIFGNARLRVFQSKWFNMNSQPLFSVSLWDDWLILLFISHVSTILTSSVTFALSLATQQGTREGSSRLDLRRSGGTGASWRLREHLARWNRALQACQQIDPRMHQEDPRTRHKLPAHGERTEVGQRFRFLRIKLTQKSRLLDSKPPSRSTVSQKKKFSRPPTCSNVATSRKSPCACTRWEESPRSTRNTLDHHSDPKWLTRTSEPSRKNNCAPMKASSTPSVRDTTRALARPVTEAWATPATCKDGRQKQANYINSNYLFTWNLLFQLLREIKLELASCSKIKTPTKWLITKSDCTMRWKTFLSTHNTLRCALAGD